MEKDLRWPLKAMGSGSLSTRCTGVQDTTARQHRSCRLSTAGEGTGLSACRPGRQGSPLASPPPFPGTQAALSTHCAHAWPGAGPEKGHPASVTWD